MESSGKQRHSYADFIYALLSVASPFMAFGMVLLYHDYAYRDFFAPPGAPIDDADKNAAAMMGAVVVIELILAIGIGSLVGLVFAGLSLWKRLRFLSFGTLAMLFNLLPILGIAYLFFLQRNS
jgi:hypothetical protein